MNYRKYHDENDQEQIRAFLQDVFLRNGRREYSWPLYRWDYWVWHINTNIFQFDLTAAVFLWSDEAGKLVGVLNPDNPGEAFLQVDPDRRSQGMEVAMMSTAETQYSVTQSDGKQRLTIWCPSTDTMRQDILARRGYVRQEGAEYQRRRESSLPFPEGSLASGYCIREVGGEEDLPARSWVSWKAFHPDDPDDRYEGWDWDHNVRGAPLYRPDLDLVAVAETGEHAAFCTLWFDEKTRTAAFEPVGIHPDHQRKGLGKAVIAEGLRRVHALGATLVTVGSYSTAAGALYASMGFTEYELSEPWQKIW